MSTFIKDWLERIFWTALQAAIGVISVEGLDLPEVWIVVIAAALAMLKGLIAKQIGNPDSASTVPSIPPVENPPEG